MREPLAPSPRLTPDYRPNTSDTEPINNSAKNGMTNTLSSKINYVSL